MKKRLTPDLKKLTYFLPALFFLTVSHTLSAATEQMIHITADEQQVDLQKNIATFSGNVVVTRGQMKLTAGKAVITQTADGKQQVIEAFGSPVKFKTVLNNGKPVSGHAQKLKYETAQKRITLTGSAFLQQEASSINSSVITYLVDQQRMTASGSKNSRVSTTLMPSQLSKPKK